MKRIVVQRLGVSSVAKYVGVAHAILGVIYGVVALLAAIVAIADTGDLATWHKVLAGIAATLVAFIVIPGVAFLIGWLYGAVFALIVNFVLQTSRGIELDVAEEKVQ